MLILKRKQGDAIRIGEDIEIVIIKTGLNYTVLGVSCPKEVKVLRTELEPKEEEEEEKQQ